MADSGENAASDLCECCGQELPKRCGYCATMLRRTGDGWGWMLRRRGAKTLTLFGFSCGCYQRWNQARELAEFENSVFL
jgi:hypothetical protein